MIEVALSAVPDLKALEARWRTLEQAAEPSFFQSWTWTGCLAQERFPDPVLAEARDGGTTVGLALFNRRRGVPRDRLFLGETGAQPWDRLFVERNAPLAARGHETAVADAIYRSGTAAADLILSGTPEPSPGVLLDRQPAPFAYPDAGYWDRRSANTRQQIRRSDRACAAFGPLTLNRAPSCAIAHAWLDEMAAMHQATWAARGKPGSFTDPSFGRFHHELIRRGMPRGEIDVLKVDAGQRVVGILYNFRYRGRVSAYQSGFAYESADARLKPGLTCHRMAIEFYAREGISVYDFLAGDDRYKRSLADGAGMMHWSIAGSWWSPRLLVCRARGLARRLRDTCTGGR